MSTRNGKPLPDPGEPPIRERGNCGLGCIILVAYAAVILFFLIRGCT